MFDLRGRALEPRFGLSVPRSNGARSEPAKPFRFAVTWTSLTRHLDLCQAAQRTSALSDQPARELTQSYLPVLAGIAVPELQRPDTRFPSRDRWEMVVPKMSRADRASNALTSTLSGHANGELHPSVSMPTLDALESGRHRLLSRTFAALERCTKSLLTGPAKHIDVIPVWSRLEPPQLASANGRSHRSQILELQGDRFQVPLEKVPPENRIAKIDNLQDRQEFRELLLSKITGTLRSRSRNGEPGHTETQQDERWAKVPGVHAPS